MSLSRSLALGALLVSLFLAVSSAGLSSSRPNANCTNLGKQHNFTFGARSWRDYLLYTSQFHMKSKLWQVNSREVHYPVGGRVSSVEIIDQRRDGTGGCAWLVGGGIGYNFVTVHFETLRNHGLDFTVNVYGTR